MRRRWLLALLPVLLALPLAWWVGRGRELDIVLRVSLPSFVVAIGLLLSMLVFLGVGVVTWQRGAVLDSAARQRELDAEERRRFLQRLDHELKNPLTAIRAGLANLSATGEGRAAVESVEAQVLRLSRLTADLRKLAELENQPLARREVNLAELLTEAVALAEEQPEAGERHLSLTLPQAPWPLPSVAADWDLLFLACYNLLANALKFTQPGDTVEVRAYEDGAAVVIEVADTGPGIPAQEQPHVWAELYRGKEARRVPGSGLGLALTHAIIERHGGQTTLRSRTGQGTVVTLRLPPP